MVYNPGEWVLTGAYQNRAFVVSSDEYETEIIVTSHGNGKQIPLQFEKKELKTIKARTSGLKPAPELPKIYSYDEVNLALITRDKEWYEDIMKRKENEHAEG